MGVVYHYGAAMHCGISWPHWIFFTIHSDMTVLSFPETVRENIGVSDTTKVERYAILIGGPLTIGNAANQT